MVSTTRTIRGIATEVVLGRDDGTAEVCALSFDNTGVVSEAPLTERITRLGPAKPAESCSALEIAAGCWT